MFNRLLQSDSRGELPRPVGTALGVIGALLMSVCFYCVRAALPRAEGSASFALVILFMFALPGFVTLLAVLVKIFQGGRVQVIDQSR